MPSVTNTQVDDQGAALDGKHKYVLHFDKGQTPPAYWTGVEWCATTTELIQDTRIQNLLNRRQ